jgi:hypothetical protein
MTASQFYGPGRAVPSNLQDVGFIAQNVYNTWQTINPNIPNPVKIPNDFTNGTALSGNGDYYTINYIRMIPIITAAAKQLSTQVRELSTKIYTK